MSDDFSIEMDISEDDVDRDGKVGVIVAPGSYIFACTNLTMKTETTGDMDLELEVLSGTDPTQVGKKHHEYVKHITDDLAVEAKAVRRRIFREIAYALGCTSKDALKAATDKRSVKIDFSKALGAFCAGILVDDEYNGKHKSTFFKKGTKGAIFPLDDPRAAGIPKPGETVPPPADVPPETKPADDDFGGIV